MTLTLLTLKDDYAIWQPGLAYKIDPEAFADCEFFTMSRSKEELSIVCPLNALPEKPAGKIEMPWKGFKVDGQLDFALVGIMAQISSTLAENKISLFAISTFGTDYILVKDDVFADAKNALAAKFTVREPE